jgi:hypothetical protein
MVFGASSCEHPGRFGEDAILSRVEVFGDGDATRDDSNAFFTATVAG